MRRLPNIKPKKNKAGVALQFAKNKGYKKILEDIISTEKCPFCPDNFKYHKKPILKDYQGWLATQNSWPYPGTLRHFIIISKKHKNKFSDLSAKDFLAVQALVNWLIKKYKIKGGGLTLRFGEQIYTGATVSHLHFHLIQPKLKLNSKKAKTIWFAIG
ncbi:MAG: HIT domain-containing protein [Patescibacteria group bacterium]|nr:HIT domain-containing protein [Patescibacteria group bacterium]